MISREDYVSTYTKAQIIMKYHKHLKLYMYKNKHFKLTKI